MATKQTKNATAAVAAGAGLLAAAAAGYYFYGDKNAKKHRQAASKWAKGMKNEVVKEAKHMKKLDQKTMARVVDRAAAVYQGVRSVDRKDLRAAANELKRNWREVKAEVTGGRAPAKKAPAKRKVAAKKAPAKKKSTKRAS